MTYDFKKLKTEREKLLMTQTELAGLAGVSMTTVCLVESGNAPWKKAIRKIAGALKEERARRRMHERANGSHSSVGKMSASKVSA